MSDQLRSEPQPGVGNPSIRVRGQGAMVRVIVTVFCQTQSMIHNRGSASGPTRRLGTDVRLAVSRVQHAAYLPRMVLEVLSRVTPEEFVRQRAAELTDPQRR